MKYPLFDVIRFFLLAFGFWLLATGFTHLFCALHGQGVFDLRCLLNFAYAFWLVWFRMIHMVVS